MAHILKFLISPKDRFNFLSGREWYKWMDDTTFLKRKFYLNMGKELDLENPKTFNEKLQWLKLNDRQEKYIKMSDKYEAKKIAAQMIGEEHTIPTIGVYQKFDDIDFDKLPNQFVIKCTHDSGGVVICNDKNKFDRKAAKKKINKFLKRKYYYVHREWQYKNIQPRIIVEKFLRSPNGGDLNDYKFYCFNGKVGLCFVCSERSTKVKYTFFDRDGNFINLTQCNAANDPNVKLPKCFKEMVKLAEKMSKGIPHVRIDFYEISGKIYFGEFTFYDYAGFGTFSPEIWDYKLGDMIDLSLVSQDAK